jgi:integrase
VRLRRGKYQISYIDQQGCRVQRTVNAFTLTQARELRNAAVAQVEKDRTLGYVAPKADTFSDFAPKYLKYQKANLSERAYERSRGIVESHLTKAFGPMRLADIRVADVRKYVSERSSEVSPGTVIRELNTLKHLLNCAVDEELIPINRAHGVKHPKDRPGRLRFLQPTELRAVYEACPQWLRPIVAVLVTTGMRRGEVLNLRWLDIDRKGKQIILPQTKNGDGRIVHLNATACQAIDSIARNDSKPTDPVFAGDQLSPENVSLAFLRACRKMKIMDFRLHDLRHTFASWARMSGGDLQDVAKLLGHRDLRMTNRYAHLSSAHLGVAVGRLDGIFGPQLALQPAPEAGQGSGHAVVTIEPKNSYKVLQGAAN